MESWAKRIVWKARNEEHMANAISGKFNRKFGKHWNCLVTSKQGIVSAKFCVYNYIEIEVEDKNVIIFKSQ